jgi:hypothetical protein
MLFSSPIQLLQVQITPVILSNVSFLSCIALYGVTVSIVLVIYKNSGLRAIDGCSDRRKSGIMMI